MRTRATEWGILGIILVSLLVYSTWLRPSDSFGRYHDDSIYFSSAKALAEGRGYIIPSLPGTPPQTKYPVLYSWLISWVWRLHPAFPANIASAVAITSVFACGYLLAAFLLLSRMRSESSRTALLLTALCAFHPVFLYLSGSVLSDVPFSALVLAAAVMADAALGIEKRPFLLACTGAIAGLSIMTRTLGVAVLAGLLAAAVLRKHYRRAVIVLMTAAPFAVAGFLLMAGRTPAPLEPPGWRQTWLYYTSYGEFWRLCVPNLEVLWTMLGANVRSFLEGPATYCLFPAPGGGGSMAGAMLCITLTAGIYSGIVRQARNDEWKPIHFIFLFYACAILFWNYSLMDRFLLPFLPLFYAGAWIEGRHLVSALRRTLSSRRRGADRIVAVGMAAVIFLVAALAIRQYISGFRPQLRGIAMERATMAAEKREAYDWITRNTVPGTRFIAYEDVQLYLYTGREAVRPIVFSTEAFYTKSEAVLERDLSHLTDTARQIGAGYWVTAADDFALETGLPLIGRRVSELRSTLPLAFESRHGKVSVYDLSAMQKTASLKH